MAEALQQLLDPRQTVKDPQTLQYLAELTGQHAQTLQTSEPERLAHASHSLLISTQALSKRSRAHIVSSAASHASLRQSLPNLAQNAAELGQAVPRLDYQAESFSGMFSKAADNKALARRKEALRLLQNSERLVDAMEIPPLLASAIATAPVHYASTLDLYAHVRRLASIYPSSPLVKSVTAEADSAVRQMAADLVRSLTVPNLKLAAALRTVGWLKRIVPDMVSSASLEDTLPCLYLVCRLATLIEVIGALDPLRELADEERSRQEMSNQQHAGGQQTERYLKRYIEVFREHSFSIISIFKNVSASFQTPSDSQETDSLLPIPPAISTLVMHMVDMLLETLRIYLPSVKDQAARESILTQVLYCSSSLGRLGADFGMLLATIGVHEWADLVKRHRLLAGRLESVIGDYDRGQRAAVS
jgi:conserved oligomeric Golgi complex subunit 8